MNNITSINRSLHRHIRNLMFVCAGMVLISCSEKETDPDQMLWYDSPAEIWEEYLPLGNGRLGMMPSGGVHTDRIVLNEISLWSGSESSYDNPQAASCLPEIREYLLEGRNDKAQELMYEKFVPRKDVADPRYGSYEVLGLLNLTQVYDNAVSGKDSITGYRRLLNLEEATCRTEYQVNGKRYLRECFVSRDADCIVIDLQAEEADGLNFSLSLSRDRSAELAVENGRLVMEGSLNSGNDTLQGMRYKAAVQIFTPDGRVNLSKEDGITVSDASRAKVIFSAATSYQAEGAPAFKGNGYARYCDSILEAAGKKDYEILRSEHVLSHKELYDRVRIDLPESEEDMLPTDRRLIRFQKSHAPALAELYYNYGRYLLISSTRKGSLPPNLQGLWARTIQTPWNGDYHTNINVQMNHWPSYGADLGELNEPLIELVRRLVPSGEHTARIFYGPQARGWVMHMMTNVWNYTAPGEHPSWGATNTGGAWLCAHLWEHYLFSRDSLYLREIYPIMKGASEFFASTMIREKEHGWLVTAPTSSPENAFYLDNGMAPVSICMGPTMDVQIITELYENVIHAAHILNVDRDYADTLKNCLNDFPPMQISQEGYLQEWLKDYKEAEIHHRHVSHLYGLYPGYQISPYKTPELAEAARKTLDRRGDAGTGWSRAWKINFWARLKDGERAWELFGNLMYPAVDSTRTKHFSGTYPNLFCAHPPFQIDGNFGGTAGIAEMLLQSHEGFIHLLPAIPGSWDHGYVKGMIARPGTEIDFEWEDLKLRKAKVTARHDDLYRIRIPDYCREARARCSSGEILNESSGTLDLKLKQGETAEIEFLTDI